MKISSVVLLLLIICFASALSAQTVTGEWYGVGKVKKAGDHNSYLSEMILKQKGRKVTGSFSYFYRSVEIKTKVSGTYDPRFKVVELLARPILNYLAEDRNGADCPMEGSFTLKIAKGKSTLEGQFNPTYDYRITCPAIDVKFTKSIPTKDTVSLTEDADDADTVLPKTPAKKPVTAIRTDTVRKTAPVYKPAIVNKTDSLHKSTVVPKADTTRKPAAISNPPAVNKPLTEDEKIAVALKQRAFDVPQIIDVDADSLKVSLYDNGEVDNDSISLFYNRKLVASKLMLSSSPLEFTLPLDNGVNEIAIFAENLGKIPPNTALAIIYAGQQRFELTLTSNLSKNAAIRFRKKVKKADPKNIN